MFLGRVVRPGIDPQWLDTDRGYALAWTANKNATCSRCGTRHDEWDPKQGGDRDAYAADVHYCRGDALLAEAAEQQVPRDPDGRPMPGYVPFLLPRAAYDAAHPIDDDS